MLTVRVAGAHASVDTGARRVAIEGVPAPESAGSTDSDSDSTDGDAALFRRSAPSRGTDWYAPTTDVGARG